MSEKEKKIYKTRDVADMFGVTTTTLLKWDKKGFLKASRMPSGRLYYTKEQIENYFKLYPRIENYE